LAAYVVWVPQLAAQLRNVAPATSLVPDPRARHFWDPTNSVGIEYGKELGIGFPAWDVYMMFGPDAVWRGALPPKPSFWMHQLAGVNAAPMLDPEEFARKVSAQLEALPQ
jgi:hypothetical protein